MTPNKHFDMIASLVFTRVSQLLTAWKNGLKNPKFDLFSDGLEAAMENVEEYY